MSSLVDLLPRDDGDGLPLGLRELWQTTEAAPELKQPLPAGVYRGVLERVELATSGRGTPAVRLTFRISEGEHAGRRLRHHCWLTPRALPFTKRDLAKLGIGDFGQVTRPLPGAITCRLRIGTRRDDDGRMFNHVSDFVVVRADPLPELDPFAPGTHTPEANTEGPPF